MDPKLKTSIISLEKYQELHSSLADRSPSTQGPAGLSAAPTGKFPRSLGLVKIAPKGYINLAKYRDSVTMWLKERCSSWAFGINVDNQLYHASSDGWLRVSPDTPSGLDGAFMLRPGSKMDIYSCSKTITAVAIGQLLHSQGLSWHTPVRDFLPPDYDTVGVWLVLWPIHRESYFFEPPDPPRWIWPHIAGERIYPRHKSCLERWA